MILKRTERQRQAQEKFRTNNKEYLKQYERERYLKRRDEQLKKYHENKPIITRVKKVSLKKEITKPKIIDFNPRKRYSVFHISEIMRKFPKHELNSKIIAKFTESDFKEFERLEQSVI